MNKFKIGNVVMTNERFPLGVRLHGVITKVSKEDGCYIYRINNGKINGSLNLYAIIAEKWLIQV